MNKVPQKNYLLQRKVQKKKKITIIVMVLNPITAHYTKPNSEIEKIVTQNIRKWWPYKAIMKSHNTKV